MKTQFFWGGGEGGGEGGIIREGESNKLWLLKSAVYKVARITELISYYVV